MRRSLLALAVAVPTALAGGLGAAPASGVIDSPLAAPAGSDRGLPSVDVRRTGRHVGPDAAARAAAASLSRKGARVSWNSTYGTAHSVTKVGGYLSGPRSGSAVDVARAWIAEHRALFGLSPADVAALTVTRQFSLGGTSTQVVNFAQTFDGLPAAYGGSLVVAVTKDGRILTANGDTVRTARRPAAATLNSSDAVSRVAKATDAAVAFTAKSLGRIGNYEAFDKGGFFDAHYVRKVAFATADGARTAYRVVFTKSVGVVDDVVIDAESGAVLYRASLVDSETDGSGRVFPNYPGAPRGGTQVSRPFGDNDRVAPEGWLFNRGQSPFAGPNEYTTHGNNANTYSNPDRLYPPSSRTGPRPTPTRPVFAFPFTDQWNDTSCRAYARDVNPAVTNLFYQHNRIHDEFYRYGFTEAAGNFQRSNFGRGGLGSDAIQGLAQDGINVGGIDNAFMATRPEGLPPFSGMFLWAPIPGAFLAPCADGSYDASVIEHEYAHGLSNRMVGTGLQLNTLQSGSMGEGWSDWYALNYIFNAGLQTEPVAGIYVTGNAERGIRNWNYDQNPLHYGDIGYDITGPEVHADGELWTATLWDLRKAFAGRGKDPGDLTAHLVTDGMPLTPNNPTMLDARDAILQADVNRYGGAHLRTIWRIFAARGMGVGAQAGPSEGDAPVASFRSPYAADNGALSVRVVNERGAAVPGLNVFVGPFEARVTPLGRTSASGVVGAAMVPGAYTIAVQGRGYGYRSTGVSVGSGSRTLTVQVSRNLASTANGAKVAGVSSVFPGFGAAQLLDDTEATSWATEPAADLAVRSGSVTVRLAKPSTIRRFTVSAFKAPELPRFAAMRNFTIEVSTDGAYWTTAVRGAFPTTNPRPVAPLLHYKSFAPASPVSARYVRLKLESTQGVAQLAVAAELQAFSTVSR